MNTVHRAGSHPTSPLLMDGALGTELQRAGIRPGECYEAWNLTHPERVRAIHQAYFEAGARCLVTNTFQSNPTALARHGLADQLETIHRAAVSLCRSVGQGNALVLGSVGPLEVRDDADRVLRSLVDSDAILLETWSDPTVFELVGLARLPVLVSLAYLRTPGGVLSRSGHTPEFFAQLANEHRLAALGVNCGRHMGLDEVSTVLRAYRSVTQVPLFARPNAGTPVERDGQWHYPLTPEMLAARVPELIAAGASLIGGCCGTTPAHIRAVRSALEHDQPNRGC